LAPARRYAQLLQPLLGTATGYAHSIVHNRHDADDAVQQAALRGLERLSSYDELRPFKAWWFAILRNCCIDLLRQRKSSNPQISIDDQPSQPQPEGSGSWEDLVIAMNRLSEEHREILRLRYFGDLNYAELAENLRIPMGTVMSRLHLARKALRNEL
jgi:RNA polymerase sigma-70 factor (ECF subfamily)